MFRRFSVNFAIFSIIVDTFVIVLAMLASAWLRPYFIGWSFIKQLPGAGWFWPGLYGIFPALWIGVFLFVSLYDGRKNLRVVDEFGSLTLGSFLATISMAGVLYFLSREVSRFQFLLFVSVAYASLLLWRSAARIAFRWNALNSFQRRRVLIAVVGETGQRLREQIDSLPFLGLTVVGFLADEPVRRGESSDIVGRLDQVREVISQSNVDDVVIALPLSAYRRLNQLVAELHDLPVKVWIIPDYFSLSLHRASVEEFAGIPMLDLRAPALSDYQRMVKRAFDLVVTCLGLPFTLLVVGLIALAIRLDSPGPIFLKQKRVGENGKLFEMIKFRSMVENAEQLRNLVEQVDDNGHIIQNKNPDDPRVTRVGHFLRRTSLDELPQLMNVLRGNMSLVGHRPELPYLVEKYELWQRKRFAVPQGMTGWWQVSGRSDKPMHLHTEEDLYYVQHYSLWLDLQIMFKTLSVVLRGKGAY